MKNTFKSFIVLASAMLCSMSLWAEGISAVTENSFTVPSGTYIYFTCPAGAKDFELNDVGDCNNQGVISGTTTWKFLFTQSKVLSPTNTPNAKYHWQNSSDQWSDWHNLFVSNTFNIAKPSVGDNNLIINSDGSTSWTIYGQDPNKVTISFSAGDGGSIVTHTANDVEISSGASIDKTSTVVLVAEPNQGYRFLRWIDGSSQAVSESANYSFSIQANTTLTATFIAENEDEPIAGCEGCFKVQ